jgi:hypothetical protein
MPPFNLTEQPMLQIRRHPDPQSYRQFASSRQTVTSTPAKPIRRGRFGLTEQPMLHLHADLTQEAYDGRRRGRINPTQPKTSLAKLNETAGNVLFTYENGFEMYVARRDIRAYPTSFYWPWLPARDRQTVTSTPAAPAAPAEPAGRVEPVEPVKFNLGSAAAPVQTKTGQRWDITTGQYIIRCQSCGLDFHSARPQTKTCSAKCRKALSRDRKPWR